MLWVEMVWNGSSLVGGGGAVWMVWEVICAILLTSKYNSCVVPWMVESGEECLMCQKERRVGAWFICASISGF